MNRRRLLAFILNEDVPGVLMRIYWYVSIEADKRGLELKQVEETMTFYKRK